MERLLGLHDSQPHNSIIANVLYKSTILESWGRGIKLMVDECRRVGIPDPEFHCDGGFVWVIFHYTRNIAGEDRPSTDQVMTLVKVLANEEMSETSATEIPPYRKGKSLAHPRCGGRGLTEATTSAKRLCEGVPTTISLGGNCRSKARAAASSTS